MVSVAFLRGINVGGNRKVEMTRLRTAVAAAGFGSVQTYINTGNVMFTHADHGDTTSIIERAIETEFGFHVDVLVRNAQEIERVMEAIPAEWTNDTVMKTDVIFLPAHRDHEEVREHLGLVSGIDDHVVYTKGAVIWMVSRANQPKSGMTTFNRQKLFKEVTIRNCNTVRAIGKLMANYSD